MPGVDGGTATAQLVLRTLAALLCVLPPLLSNGNKNQHSQRLPVFTARQLGTATPAGYCIP